MSMAPSRAGSPFVHERPDGSLVITHNLEALRRRLQRCTERIPHFAPWNGLSLSDLSTPELLAQFPILSKSDLIERGSALYEMPLDDTVVFSETGGTTAGRPLVTPRSAEELRWNSRNLARAFDAGLDRRVDRVAILHPAIMSPFAEACGIALMSLGVPYLRVYPIPNVCSYQRLLTILRDYGISCIMTTPALAYKLLYERAQLGPGEQRWAIRRFLLTGELITRASLANMASMFDGDCRVFVYGSSEAATCLIGADDARYEPCLGDFAYELLPMPGQDASELVVTWLNTGIRPLVRYATGDCFRFGVSPAREGRLWFESMGRVAAERREVDFPERLDEFICGLGAGVYHYELRDRRSNPKLVLITDGRPRPGLEGALRDGLAPLGVRQVDVVLNPEQHEFREFSPRPKLARIVG